MWLLAIPLAAIVVASFWAVTRNDFLNWDDEKNFVSNPHYWGLGWAQFRWAWTAFLLGVYQPVAWMLLEAQYSMFALAPWGYHATSVLLHVSNSVILYVLTIALIGRAQPTILDEHPWKCFASAALLTTLFAVHPLRTEVVAWVSCQPYLPCASFYLLAIGAYLRANPQHEEQQRRWHWASYALFVAGLLSKAVAVTLPFVLVILDAYPLNRLGLDPRRWFARSSRGVWAEKLPFFVTSVAFMVIATWARRHMPILAAVEPKGLSAAQLAQSLYGVGFYVSKTLVPVRITGFYAKPVGGSWLDPLLLVPILLAITVTALVIGYRRRFPAAAVAWLCYVVMLGPNLGLVRISNQIAADRYSYLPLMSLVVLGAGTLAWCWCNARLAQIVKAGVLPVSAIATIVLVALAQAQNRTWRSDEALWTYAMNNGQAEVAEIHNFLALALVRESRLDEAEQHVTKSLQLTRTYAGAHNTLGIVLGEQGKLPQAADEFREALRLDPRHVNAHLNMGSVLLREQQVERAISQYAVALELEPDNGPASRLLRRILLTTPPRDGRLVKGVQAVLQDPGNRSAHRALTDALEPYVQ